MHTLPKPREDVDRVVLLGEEGQRIGTMPRSAVHHDRTPLHLAFSCYLFNERNEVLITRRALTKAAWPGVWTNSFCGHPRPGERYTDAVRRHARHELGTTVGDVQVLVPDFRYRAVDPGGVVENEVCPVYCARTASSVAANPDEVMDLRWVPAADLGRLVGLAPWLLSPWFVQQVHRLGDLAAEAPLVDGACSDDGARLVG